jgi:hypothetical protein
MGQIRAAQPVKLFIGMLFTSELVAQKARFSLQEKFGTVDKESPLWPFKFTDYYNLEMGTPLLRKFIAFQSLIDPNNLKEVKLYTNDLETQLSQKYSPPTRPINLDPGYLSLSKVILATAKDYTHRIYLGDGIYAEVTLHYQHKTFCPWDWTYPDYATDNYIDFFAELREIYRQQLASC